MKSLKGYIYRVLRVVVASEFESPTPTMSRWGMAWYREV